MATLILSEIGNPATIAPLNELRAVPVARSFARDFVSGAILALILFAGVGAISLGETAIENETLDAGANPSWYWAAADASASPHP